MPRHIINNMSNRMPEHISDRISEDIRNKIPEYISNKMIEDLSITKYIDILMGKIRKKIILSIISYKVVTEISKLFYSG